MVTAGYGGPAVKRHLMPLTNECVTDTDVGFCKEPAALRRAEMTLELLFSVRVSVDSLINHPGRH